VCSSDLLSRTTINKDKKETPTQRNSHFPMCLEAILKDVRFRPPPPKKPNEQGRVAPLYMRR
jgi:hypothetical protein